MGERAPRWRRRKTDRPEEIAAAAFAVFAERGFAAARVEDIAARAGLSKAALYVYFPTKTDLFRAVLAVRAVPNLDGLGAIAAGEGRPFAAVLDAVLGQLVAILEGSELGSLARMVIAESGNFPELAKLWHDTVVSRALGLLTGLIEAAQARGEVRDGSARHMAMTLVAPLLLGALWREVMEPAGGAPLDIRALAAEHGRTALAGLLAPRAPAEGGA